MLPSGVFNCSVGHYPSFKHHLDCNLMIECSDGQDEGEHCPFGSPECLGLLMCGRCYIFVSSRMIRESQGYEHDIHTSAKEYCKSRNGTVAVPTCEVDWYGRIRNQTKPYAYIWGTVWIGMAAGQTSVPNLYRNNIIIDDKNVLYHFVRFADHRERFHIETEYIYLDSGEFILNRCDSVSVINTICEFKTHQSKNLTYSPQVMRLTGTPFSPQSGHPSLTTCFDGHVTHTFLLCGSQQKDVCGQGHSSCTFTHDLIHAHHELEPAKTSFSVPTFTCDDGSSILSYTLVCDFLPDCQDFSDESFCRHPICVSTFTCTNGQCVSYDLVCDRVFQCLDKSDESNCMTRRVNESEWAPYFPSPALIQFDGVNTFTSTPMNSSESCPDSHYRCPGKYNDCLPVYTRCNGMYDCMDHEDEVGCEAIACPGFFHCRRSKLCLHGDHLCDGWPHCPLHDDEMACDMTCPVQCICQGHTFWCPRPFPAYLFPDLRYLDATSTGMNLSDVSSNVYLSHLVLAHCSMVSLSVVNLFNLQFLDLIGNKLQNVSMAYFVRLENLQILSLSSNPLISLYSSPSSAGLQSVLTTIDLSHTNLTVFDANVLSSFLRLQKLNLTYSTIHTIRPDGFQFIKLLSELYMEGNPVKVFPSDVFKNLQNLRVISADNYKLCCDKILPHYFDDAFCNAPRSEISSCEDLLQSGLYRGFLWLISCLSLTGNSFCFVVRLCTWKKSSSRGFGVFVINLSMADFLMGVYIAIIGVADELSRGIYIHFDDTWKSSDACKVAGFLSLLSSEVSALVICLITLDRFISLHFPFSTFRFDRMSATVACALTWLAGLLLALFPLLPVTAHWEFYSQTGICIPLPVTRNTFKGRVYSFSVLIVLNFILFVLISAGQTFIYWSVKKNALTSTTSSTSRDMTIARRLISVAATDFMCWFPIGLCGFLALAGISIPGEVNVALAIFVLPLNSALNPFMYTFNMLAEKRRKSNETKVLKWLESHADLALKS